MVFILTRSCDTAFNLACDCTIFPANPLFPDLNVPLHNPDRRNIRLPPLHRIVCRSPQKDPTKHDNVPIHGLRLNRRGGREEAKDKERHQEN